jgi:hypothetical protein
MTASHVPMRGESAMAMKGKHVDGLAAYAQMGVRTREPEQGNDRWTAEPGSTVAMDARKPSNMGTRMSPTAGKNVNKSG